MTDYLLSYRMEDNDSLITEKAALKAQRSVFSQQSMGLKSFVRDLRLLEDKLQAVNYVLRERGYVIPSQPAQNNTGSGIVDFSQIT